jgi:hypothetical protein
MPWKKIYRDLNQYLMENNQQLVNISYFHRMNRKYFLKVKALKYTKQAKYETYIELKEARGLEKDPRRQKIFINNSWITIGSKWQKGINTRQKNFVVFILASYLSDLKDIHQTNWPRTFYLEVDN